MYSPEQVQVRGVGRRPCLPRGQRDQGGYRRGRSEPPLRWCNGQRGCAPRFRCRGDVQDLPDPARRYDVLERGGGDPSDARVGCEGLRPSAAG
jgi:hypothetical protein